MMRVAVRQPVEDLRLRSGSTLSAPPSADLWNHFNDIWLRGCYTSAHPLPHGGDVIDIGANVGIFSLLASPAADRVIAFEPLPQAFHRLQRNVASTTGNVICVQQAVAGQRGKALLRPSPSLTAGRLAPYPGPDRAVGPVHEVDTVTLTDIFDRWSVDVCAFLKMDCEGAEFDIFATTPSPVFQRIRRLSLEVHEEISGRSAQEILDRLGREGFSTHVRSVGPGCLIVSAAATGR
jgi:FkbM family methyltransferase